jgi:hypothetical protein
MATDNPSIKKIKTLIILFIIGLLLSGITAFPLETELELLYNWVPNHLPGHNWIEKVYHGIKDTNTKYPFMAYGTDWLAFAHIAIAVFFIGVYRDPLKNIWIIEASMIISVLILPLAFIAGSLRGIPFYWQLIDCSFGLFSIIVLWPIRQLILKLDSKSQ